MTDPRDIFGSGGGGGSYPKVADLEGKLVLLKPSKIEVIPKPERFNPQPGETQERATADCTVFEDDGTWETYDNMYFSQTGLVNPCKKALKPGAKPFVLGRVGKVPSKPGKLEGFDTTEKIEKALKEHYRTNGKAPKPSYAWGLNEFSEADGQLALKYLASIGGFAAAE